MENYVVNEVRFDAYDKDLNIVEGASVEIKHGNGEKGIKTNLQNLPINIFNVLNELFLPFIKEGVSLEVNVYGLEDFDLMFSAGPMVNAIRKAVEKERSELMMRKMRESRSRRGRMLREGRRPFRKRMIKESRDIEELRDVPVIEGTQRTEDLFPVMYGILKEYAPELANDFAEYAEDDSWMNTEDAHFVMEDLFNALCDIAPEGCYFGGSDFDGASYGFWSDDPYGSAR